MITLPLQYALDKAMNISEVHLYQHQLPVKDGPYVMANAQVCSLQTTLVKLVTDTGVEGWGETCPVGPTYAPSHAEGAFAALKEMAPGLIGANPLQPLCLYRHMDSLLNSHNYAKAAIDIAAHDILGKVTGLRVADLLGGAETERVPCYYATGVGSAEDIAKLAAEKVAEGFSRIQVKVGGRPIEIDIEVIRKVWEAVGTQVRLALDANRGWTTRDAIRISQECRDIPFVIEQPCNTLEEIAAVRPLLNHAVFIDESSVDLNTVLSAVGQGICDGFGMKVTRIGGLTPMRDFRAICEARSLPHTCDDSWGGDIIAAACVHMGATIKPKLLEGVWLAQSYIEGHYDPNNGIEINQGYAKLPDVPGLGVQPDEGIFGQPAASFA